MQDERDEPTIPPEGTSCREHPDDFAVVVCPHCERPACMTCWHMEINRCHTCLARSTRTPISWENDEALLARYVKTIASAFRPATCADFGPGDPRRAIPFFWASFVPLSLLAGIIPFTATLGFGDAFGVQRIGEATDTEIALDIGQAMLRGFALASVQLLALAAPFISLTRAYATQRFGAALHQVIVYRAFLVPLSSSVSSLVTWGIPASQLVSGPTLLAQVAMLPALVPLAFMFVSLRSTARMAARVTPFSGFIVSMVAMMFMLATTLVIGNLLLPTVQFEPSALSPQTAPASAP